MHDFQQLPTTKTWRAKTGKPFPDVTGTLRLGLFSEFKGGTLKDLLIYDLKLLRAFRIFLLKKSFNHSTQPIKSNVKLNQMTFRKTRQQRANRFPL